MANPDTLGRTPDEIQDELFDRLDETNPEALPEIEKVVVNVGIGDARENVDRLETVREQLQLITGQKPIVTRARKSIADFGIREGDPSGLKVTLREERMEDFIQRLIHFVLPMTKEFRGLPMDSFDGHGNYSLGIDEQVVFPEVSPKDSEVVFGMDITVVTSRKETEAAFQLLDEYGFPFEDEE